MKSRAAHAATAVPGLGGDPGRPAARRRRWSSRARRCCTAWATTWGITG